MSETKPDDIRVGQSYRVSRLEYDACPERFNHMSEKEMREAIAHFIQGVRAETRFDEAFVEKRIDLYVATPEQFWGLIHKEAQEIAMRWGRAR